MLEAAPETGPFLFPGACFTLKAMTPADPAPAAPATASPDVVPDYVRVLEQAAAYLPAGQLPVLRRAWTIGAAAHAGQNRRSGEPYITHPVAVATALAEQHVDVETLVAAILHDTLEDTPLSRAIASIILRKLSAACTTCAPSARRRPKRACASPARPWRSTHPLPSAWA